MWTTKNIPDQRGKTMIVTGANSGIGFETARELSLSGAYVILACRNFKNAQDALERIRQISEKATVEASVLDLSDLYSVKQFAKTVLQTHSRLDVLINNAGVATPPETKTAQGYELQFGVNFLGHFALTGYLYPLLRKTKGSRIVTLSSNGYQHASIDFQNLRSEISYDPMREYRQSKLANLIFSVELNRRIGIKGDEVLSIATQPGANKTELTRHLSPEEIAAGVERLGTFMEPWQGALSTLFAAVSEEAVSGKLIQPHEDGYRGYPSLVSIKENALDTATGKKLWELAEEITGIHFP
ncbi:oxidoreductase [Fluviicola chungangensis]|uniref:SDR family NAD(P)-dependent oxidoreductase n=1 Tax=Fluviicola chungangensis TaxID=2597671 RepID=A0A556MYG1_9FLAO|nr:oxidoreductase [Fluviicola chungangensis]TSJ44873.1 SDR family NAD(P)-dependent oxidoreductase [Fluviicola chungangensis]